MKEVIIASKNKGKIREFVELFAEEGIQVLSLYDFPSITDVEETGDTFHENAQLKAETVAHLLDKPVIADDSGLIVDALDGRPGVYSARYAGEPTNDEKNNEKLLSELIEIKESARTARFISVLALARPSEDTILVEGFCEGKIAFHAKGDSGFGYDPIFIPDGYDMSMAQLGEDEKNKISHRYHSLKKLKQYLRENGMI